MSAQRRAAGKRDATATPQRAATSGPAVVPAAAAAAPPRPTPTPQAARPPKPAAAPQSSRPPKPAIDRGRPGASEERGRLTERTAGLRRLYADTLAELKKVNWPDRETTKNLTLVVIGVSVVLGILLGGIDFVLQTLFEAVP